MKVRFYCDIPSHGVRLHGQGAWPLVAWSLPPAVVIEGWTRVAFDVDMPPGLVVPEHDVIAPAGAAVEEAK